MPEKRAKKKLPYRFRVWKLEIAGFEQ